MPLNQLFGYKSFCCYFYSFGKQRKMLSHALKATRIGLNRNLLFMPRLLTVKRNSTASTNEEVVHHAKMAKDWWDINGPMGALHALNEIRIPFIRDGLVARGNVDKSNIKTTNVLLDQKILEVGCGGGILTEQLARLGATVTGIDLGEEVIRAAKEHLDLYSSNLQQHITYKVQPVEVHVNEFPEYYDAVVVSEVIEHVDDKANFLTHCVNSLKPGGSIFITTPNKTIPMWLGGILISENILNIAPKGTHHWDKLISPVDVQRILDALNCQTVLVNGSTYEFWSNTWKWVDCTLMCYALQAIKADENGNGHPKEQK